eukprot:925220-Rhodomonas_salina.1
MCMPCTVTLTDPVPAVLVRSADVAGDKSYDRTEEMEPPTPAPAVTVEAWLARMPRPARPTTEVSLTQAVSSHDV